MKTQHLVLVIPLVLLAACGRKEAAPEAAPATAPAAAAKPAAPAPGTARVSLVGKSGSAVKGDLKLSLSGGAVVIDGNLSGLTPGTEHGFHVHETGDCSAPDAKSAGEHFNPEHVEHGGPTSATRHLGDIPNIQSDAAGNATVSAQITTATLGGGGPNDLMGKALIVHAQRDDYVTQPSGDSGDRIACGVIR